MPSDKVNSNLETSPWKYSTASQPHTAYSQVAAPETLTLSHTYKHKQTRTPTKTLSHNSLTPRAGLSAASMLTGVLGETESSEQVQMA